MFLSRCAGELSIFFSLSLSLNNLACVNGYTFYSSHVRNSRVLRSFTTDPACARAKIDIWSRTSCSSCARHTHTQFAIIKSEDDLTMSDVCCIRGNEKCFAFKRLSNVESQWYARVSREAILYVCLVIFVRICN